MKKSARKKPAIGAWRGRPIEPTPAAVARLNAALEDPPADVLEKFVYRGVKPKWDGWKDFEVWFKGFLRAARKRMKHLERAEKKFYATDLAKWGALYDRQVTRAARNAAKAAKASGRKPRRPKGESNEKA